MKKLLLSLLCLSMIFTQMTFVKAETNNQYDIYPIVRDIEYHSDENFVLQNVNIVKESGIDEATINYLKEVLDENKVSYTMSSSKTDGVNILLGIEGSNESVDTYSKDIQIKTEDLYGYYDAYMIDIKDKSLVIMGKDSDAVFYGVATLKMMLSSVEDNALLGAHIEDYSTLEYRGFIEGFYGGWDYPTRASLMNFAKDIKMNTYVYASKTDAYHTHKWNQLYPQSDIDQIAELVKIGQETKCYYAWSVHISSFFSGLDTSNTTAYEQRYSQLIAKFDQLYNVGVRKFDILNDDFGAGTNEDVVALLNRLTKEYIEPKGCEPITYCPQGYNVSWQGNGSELAALSKLDDSIILYWTGADVNSPIEQSSIDYATNKSGHDVCFWLNYPVNEHGASGVYLGDITHYARDNVKLRAAVSNPCRYGQANKVGLFQLAALFWNNSNYSQYANEVYLNSFNYLEKGVEDAYKVLAQNIANCPNSSRVPQGFNESEYIKEQLESVLAKANAGTSIKDDEETLQLLASLNEILSALDTFTKDCTNTQLVNELTPWLNSLDNITNSCLAALKAIIAIEEDNLSLAWEQFSKASKTLQTWDDYPTFSGSDKKALAGSKRLQPFASKLVNKVKNTLTPIFDPSYTDFTPSLYAVLGGSEKAHDNNANKLFDNNLSTSIQWNTVQKKDDYYGVDLGRVIKVTDIEIVQGNTDTDHDYFHKAILEYSKDGITFTSIGQQYNDTTHIYVDGLDIEARYVRLRLVETGTASKPDYWTHVREFSVNKEIPTGNKVYTNVETYKETPLTISNKTYSLSNLKNITLKQNEYIGIKFIDIVYASSFVKSLTNDDKLNIEYSLNGTTWQTLDNSTKNTTVKYVRIINKNKDDVTFNLNDLGVTIQSTKANPTFLETNLTNGIKEGAWTNVFDKNDATYVWTNEAQTAGDYITFDLGMTISLHDIEILTADGNPRLYNAEIQISTDNTNWETIAKVENDNSVFEVPYRYVRTNALGKDARYLRIYITANTGYYLKIQEIKINQTVENHNTDMISSTFANDVNALIDKDLSTLVSSLVSKDDIIEYIFTEGTRFNSISLLQDPSSISNATVELYGENGYEIVGTLNESASVFDLDHTKDYTKLRISFDKDTQINLYEIYLDYSLSSDDIGVYVDPIIKTPTLTKENIILNKDISVSGTSNGVKESINDGDTSTKWDSDNIKGNNAKDNAWVIVDLGEDGPYIFNESIMNYFNKVYPTVSNIQISNDLNHWYTIKEMTSEHNGPTHPVENVQWNTYYSSRYIKLFFDELNNVAAGNGVGLNEWIVNGYELTNTNILPIEDMRYTLNVGDSTENIIFVDYINVSFESNGEVFVVNVPLTYESKYIDTSTAGTTTIVAKLDVPFETDVQYNIVVEVKGENKDVLAESITLDKDNVELKVNETLTLNATVLPDNTTDKSVTWTSSNPKVATVKDGVVTALKAGTTTITVTTTNGLKATCKVTVLKDFPFTDVSDKQWYYGVINEAYQLGLMTGASDSLFKPNANMNRGMVAIVFHRMEGSKQVEYSSIFPDVANKQYYTTSVLWAKQTGVINGYTNGTFKPLRNVTREEMATMIYNFARYKGLDMSASKDITYFSDYSQITPYAVGPLQWAVEKGLMSGKLNGTKLDPLGNATRAECSKMLVQAYKVIYK